MNKKTGSIIVGLLLIGMVSAGLVPYLSNMVSGNVVVEGPVFYTTTNEISGTNFNSLWINNYDNSSTFILINEDEKKTFLTEEFTEELNFYQPKFNLYVESQLIEGTSPKRLKLKIGYYEDINDGNLYEICAKEVEVISPTEYQTYSTTCQGNSTLQNVGGFYYSIEGLSTGSVKINTRMGEGETKVEMTKA